MRMRINGRPRRPDMWQWLLLVVLVAVAYTTGGEFKLAYRTRDELAKPTATEGEVEIAILRESSSILNYLNGNCSWRFVLEAGGAVVEAEVSVGPQRILEGEGRNPDFTLKCVADGTEQLTALITIHGESLELVHWCML